MTNTPTLGPLGPEKVTARLDDMSCLTLQISDGPTNSAIADLNKDDQARLFLYLAQSLDINLNHLADYATNVGNPIQAIAIDRVLQAAKDSP